MKITVLLFQFMGMVLAGYAATPGRLALWSGATHTLEKVSLVQHNTLSLTPLQAAERAQSEARNSNVVVVLRNLAAESADLLALDEIAREIKLSSKAEVFSNIHRSTGEKQKNTIDHLLASSKVNSIRLSNALAQLEGTVAATADGESGHMLDVFFDPASAADVALLPRLFAAARSHAGQKKLLFVAVDEPSADAVMPTEHANYARLLTPSTTTTVPTTVSTSSSKTTTDTTSTTPIAGAEFSIYHEGTYLYITPDIFTGLMTMLFMVGVALTGFSCMGSIQGMTSFYDKVPSNGREA